MPTLKNLVQPSGIHCLRTKTASLNASKVAGPSPTPEHTLDSLVPLCIPASGAIAKADTNLNPTAFSMKYPASSDKTHVLPRQKCILLHGDCFRRPEFPNKTRHHSIPRYFQRRSRLLHTCFSKWSAFPKL